MIQLIFEYGVEKVIIIVTGKDVRFGNIKYGNITTTIDGLRLDYNGVIREFPDLELNKNWRQDAIARFKKKIQGFENEQQIADYLIEDLKKFGYKLKGTQKKGFRTK